MKRFFPFLLILSLFLFFACIKEEERSEYLHIKDRLPEFSVFDLSGMIIDSDTLTNKKVSMIVFFHSSCSDCRRELPKIDSIWKKLNNHPDFCLMTIARGEQAATVSDFFIQYHFTMPVYLDPQKEAFLLFANQTVPRLYLSDKNGIIRYIAIEKLDLTAEQLIEKILALLE